MFTPAINIFQGLYHRLCRIDNFPIVGHNNYRLICRNNHIQGKRQDRCPPKALNANNVEIAV